MVWTIKHLIENHFIGISILKRVAHFHSKPYLCEILKHVYSNLTIICNGEISGSHGGKYEDDCLLGCCAM
jgi:hypothetical protein